MSNTENVITVTILDRAYQIKCPVEEAAQLQEAARYLSAEIRKLNHSSNTFHIERLAIVAALNVTHELLILKNQKNDYIDTMHVHIKSLQQRIQHFFETKEESAV